MRTINRPKGHKTAMKKSIYYRAAEILDKWKPHEVSGACMALARAVVHPDDNELIHEFEFMFEPTCYKKDTFKVDDAYWLWSYNRTPEQNRQDRIIALLLMDQIHQDNQIK